MVQFNDIDVKTVAIYIGWVNILPDLKEHIEHTMIRYDVSGESIHKWMDEPAKLMGSAHRLVRHNTRQILPKYLIDEYGEDLAYNIMLDHILEDTKTPNGYLLESRTLIKKVRRYITLDKDLNDLLHSQPHINVSALCNKLLKEHLEWEDGN